MAPHSVEIRVPAENSWAVEATEAIREAAASAEHPARQPAAQFEVGSGAGELVLTWTDLDAEGALDATRIALDVAGELLPDLDRVGFVRVSTDAQDPDVDRRRPTGT